MNAPKLRFKSFKDEWPTTELKNVSNIYDGTHQTPNYVENGVPFYSVEHVTANNFSNTKFIAEDVYQSELKRVKLEKGDILLTRIGDIGTTRLIDWDVRASFYVSLALLKINQENNSSFINQYIKSQVFQKELHERTIHVAFPKKINLGEIGLCVIGTPSLEEQTKIATFLSAVDEKISQLSQKLHLLGQYKQGIMQKLLNQKIRFKADDGSEFGEWENTKLGELLIKHEEKTDRNNQYPVLTSSRNGIFFQKDYFAGQDVASSDTTGYNVVPYGYFTYRHMSDDLVFKFNINTLCEKGIVSTLYPVFTIKETHLNKYFLQTVLNEGKEFKNFAIMQKQGGSRTYMYYSKLRELILNIPTLPEQTKIANFLSAIDQKIDVVSEQLEQAKLWKKGLLQQMFV